VHDMTLRLGYRRHLIHAFRPLVRALLLQQSPYYHAGRPGRFNGLMQGMKLFKKRPSRIEAR
jgi:hypothetical protein